MIKDRYYTVDAWILFSDLLAGLVIFYLLTSMLGLFSVSGPDQVRCSALPQGFADAMARIRERFHLIDVRPIFDQNNQGESLFVATRQIHIVPFGDQFEYARGSDVLNIASTYGENGERTVLSQFCEVFFSSLRDNGFDAYASMITLQGHASDDWLVPEIGQPGHDAACALPGSINTILSNQVLGQNESETGRDIGQTNNNQTPGNFSRNLHLSGCRAMNLFAYCLAEIRDADLSEWAMRHTQVVASSFQQQERVAQVVQERSLQAEIDEARAARRVTFVINLKTDNEIQCWNFPRTMIEPSGSTQADQ